MTTTAATTSTTPAATTATTASASSASAGSSATNASSLAGLSSNFNTFLSLLMTQLQNQDPTSPMDTNQFTTELVQFSSVEQQIQSNTNLTQLIQLTQDNSVLQSSSVVGKQVSVTSDHMPLQNGSGSLQFTSTSAQPVTITIANDAGTTLRTANVTATTGSNTWTWDGTDNAGNSVADGSYKVMVTSGSAGAASTSVPFTVVGTATGVEKLNNAIKIQLGALTTDFSNVQSVGQ